MSKDSVTPLNWQSELNAAAFKYHVLIAWVAVALNPIWAIGDFFNSPLHFQDFLIFRIVVSVLTLLGLLFRKKLRGHPEIIALIPFIGISIQNAYMYSVMNIDELRKHTFAYIALFIGAGMFVLWKPIYSVMVVVISFVANIVMFAMFGHLKVADILINGGMLTASVALFTILLIHTRTNLTKKEIIARLALAESNTQLAEKNEIIEEKNKDIRDSINYAQRIQQAMLPSAEKMSRELKDYFVLYKPKDIISGDFYWYTSTTTTPSVPEKAEDIVVIAAVDCTGHGVPGALMSIIGGTILNQTSTTASVNTPAEALSYLNREITRTLNSIKDGMDMSLCAINLKTLELQYAGANNPLYLLRKGQLTEVKADKQAIGADTENADVKVFTNHVMTLEKGDCIYLFTDGFADQFGGPHGKKFKYKQFQQLILSMENKPMKDQQEIMDSAFEAWKGVLSQVDDVLVIGVRV
jgi:phosphoserine phosphatase RsbU/P